MSHVYFDHTPSTPLDARVLEVMLPFLREQCGNASSRHEFGTVARKVVGNSGPECHQTACDGAAR